MYGTIYSLIPFFIVIPFAMLTKQVIPGLVVGLCVGSYMLHPTPFGGLQAILNYIIKECAVPDNLRLIVFLYGFGAFVGLIRVTGGISGFAAWMAKRIRTVRGAFRIKERAISPLICNGDMWYAVPTDNGITTVFANIKPSHWTPASVVVVICLN